VARAYTRTEIAWVESSHRAQQITTSRSGLPQLDTGAGARSILLPPMWAYGPPSDSERLYEGNQITWGVAPSPPGVKVYPESARDVALVYRCRFFTTLTALDDAEFSTAADDFLSELGDWWARFTSWVGILTMQDFVGLGGYAPGISGFRPLLT
jgi:hypothetical protein